MRLPILSFPKKWTTHAPAALMLSILFSTLVFGAKDSTAAIAMDGGEQGTAWTMASGQVSAFDSSLDLGRRSEKSVGDLQRHYREINQKATGVDLMNSGLLRRPVVLPLDGLRTHSPCKTGKYSSLVVMNISPMSSSLTLTPFAPEKQC